MSNPALFRWAVRLGLQRQLGDIAWDFLIKDTLGRVAFNPETGQPLFNETFDFVKSEIEVEPTLLTKVFNMNPEYDGTGKFLAHLEDIRLSAPGAEENTFLHFQGPTGSGKSYCAMSYRMVLDPVWDKRKICMTRGEVMERANVFTFNNCLQQDEEPRETGQGVQTESAHYKNFMDGIRKKKISIADCTPKPYVELEDVLKFRLKVMCRSEDKNWALLAKYAPRGRLQNFVLDAHPKYIVADTLPESELRLSEYQVIKDDYMAKLQSREGIGNTSDDIARRNEKILWFVDENTSLYRCIGKTKDGELKLLKTNLWNHVCRVFPYMKGGDLVSAWMEVFAGWFEQNYGLKEVKFPSKDEIFDLRNRATVIRDDDGKTIYSDYKAGGFDYRRILVLIEKRGGKPPTFKKGRQPSITAITEEMLEKAAEAGERINMGET